MPSKSRSQTITRGRATGAAINLASKPGARRLPRRRAPTHPGEMLLEEFLRPLDSRPRHATIRANRPDPGDSLTGDF